MSEQRHVVPIGGYPITNALVLEPRRIRKPELVAKGHDFRDVTPHVDIATKGEPNHVDFEWMQVEGRHSRRSLTAAPPLLLRPLLDSRPVTESTTYSLGMGEMLEAEGRRCADCGHDAVGELKPWSLWPGRFICRDTDACRERRSLDLRRRIEADDRIKSRKQAFRQTGYPDHPHLPE